eukprot:comp12219_c0_seq1/m.6990 comp12219_c0_seq1/g.6990  ORF comp12219_c0_seq1/g.6990 comp12219_c0_seq1/m.6990 type:complete len:163 (-) comp12219_c0_seq1:244-732(-)
MGKSDKREEESKCVFCQIVGEGTNKETDRVVYKDDKVAAFVDKAPVAPAHYLVVPLAHIKHAKMLKSADDYALLQHMVRVGEQLLQKDGYDPVNARLGFHWPPFFSVGHLHLHVIAPADSIGSKRHRLEFHPGTQWFRTADWVMERLRQNLGFSENTTTSTS